jgi:hypothetical protein
VDDGGISNPWAFASSRLPWKDVSEISVSEARPRHRSRQRRGVHGRGDVHDRLHHFGQPMLPATDT